MNLHPWDRRGNTIDFVRNIRVRPTQLWESIATGPGIQQWLKMSAVELPLEEGAPFTFHMRTRGRSDGADDAAVTGHVKRVIPERLLALEYRLPASGLVTELSFQIQPAFALFGRDFGHECDLWLIHSGFPSEGIGLFEFDGYFRHWRQNISDLAATLEKREGKPTPYSLAGLQFVGGAQGIGLMVAHVISGSPAEKAGIRSGDIIVAVDDRRLNSLDDFHDWIDEKFPGESGTFQLQDRRTVVTVESVTEARERFLISHNGGWTPSRN